MIRHPTIRRGIPCRACAVSCGSLILLSACALLILGLACGLAGAVDYGEINVTPANCDQWSTNLSNNESRVAGIIIENATVKSDAS